MFNLTQVLTVNSSCQASGMLCQQGYYQSWCHWLESADCCLQAWLLT